MLDFKQTETLLGFAMRGGSGRNRTVQLPLDRKEKYSAQIQTALSQPKRYVPLKTFQEIHGKLILSSNAIPCMRGLMTPLNRQLAFGPEGRPKSIVGLGKASEAREALLACDELLSLMTEQPSHITEIVPPDLPHYYCYVDFAAVGSGGVILPCTKWIQPTVWRFKNHPEVERLARQWQSSVSNSDGEAAAVFISELSLETWTNDDTAGISTHIGSDNTPTVSWNQRMATRASHKTPERLIKFQALRQRFTRRGPTDVEHISGVSNRLGDFPSRSFEEGYPADNDDAFLLEFSRRFPLVPQLGSWRMLNPPGSVTSLATSLLLGQFDTKICPKTIIGKSGVGLPATLASTLSYTTSKDPPSTWNEATCSWPLLCPSGKVSSTKLDELRARPSRRPFENAHGSWSLEDLQTLADRLQAKPI